LIFKGAVIADIHFDAIPAETLKKQLNDVFFLHLEKMEPLHMIIIAGDLIDHKISFNGESAKAAIEFVERIVSIAKKKIFQGKDYQRNKIT